MEPSIKNHNEQNPEQENSYYIRYRDYFETSGIDNSAYTYYVELVNVNDNKIWPLDDCPECQNDLNLNPPLKKYFEYTSTATKVTAVIVSFLLISFIGLKIFGTTISFSDRTLYIGSFFLILFLVLLFFFGRRSNGIQLFYCPKCNSLLYNITHHPISTGMRPNVFFAELEKLGKFRFKA
jgi:hypothetical protein